MRDAVHLQKFHIPPACLDEPFVIYSSVRHIIDQRKKKKDNTEKPSQGHGRGRGAANRGQGAESHGQGQRGQCGRGQSAVSLPGELTLNFSTSNL